VSLTKLIYITNTRLPSEKANSYQSMQMCDSFSKVFKEVEMWVPLAHNTKELSEITDIYGYYSINKSFQIKKIYQFDSKILMKLNQFVWANTKGVIFALNVILHLLKYRNDKNIVIYTRDWYVMLLFGFFKRVGIFNNKLFYESHKFSKFLLKGIKKVDGLIVINDYLCTLYKKENIQSVIVCHDGVNVEEYQNCFNNKFDKNKEKFNLVYTGSLYKWKGVYTLALAMKYINKNVELICIGGSGKYLDDFKNFVKELDLKNISIVPHVPKKETIKYIEDADVLVLPNSSKDKMSLYTSPIKLFEYMASSRPIVASNLPSICEVLENNVNAVLFEPDNHHDLAIKINNVLNSDFSEITQRAAYDVKQYTWEKRAKLIKEFIELELKDENG